MAGTGEKDLRDKTYIIKSSGEDTNFRVTKIIAYNERRAREIFNSTYKGREITGITSSEIKEGVVSDELMKFEE